MLTRGSKLVQPNPTRPAIAEEQKPLKPPATPLHGERVAEDALPAELSAWKEAEPIYPGGISTVIGDSLYIFASPGGIGDDGHKFVIGDVEVSENRVDVEAYLVGASSAGQPGRVYPKDYVKIAYNGNAKELPVDLNIHYSDAAYASPKGAYDIVDPAYLPAALRDWLTPTKSSGGKSALFGDYLYVMVSAGERQKAEQEFKVGDLVLQKDRVEVTASLAPWQGTAPPNPKVNLFARVLFQGEKAPGVKLEIREVIPADLSKVDRVVVKHTISQKEKVFIKADADRLVHALTTAAALPISGQMPPVPSDYLELQFRMYAGDRLVGEATAETGSSCRLYIRGENAVRWPSGEPMQLLEFIAESLD